MKCPCGKRGTLRCAGCKNIWYCSKECQREGWKDHSKKCHPEEVLCPYCKETNPEDDYEQGLCADCGALFCSKCIKSGAHIRVGRCPRCNVNITNKNEKLCLKKLRQLEKKILDGEHPERPLTYLYVALGGRYLRGLGCNPNTALAEVNFLKAAERGSVVAHYNLYCIYNDMFPKGPWKEHLDKAVESGYCKALCSKSMELKVAREEENKLLSAKIRSAIAKSTLPKLFEEEPYLESTILEHTDESISLLKRSALAGWADAEFELGVAFQFAQEPSSAIKREMTPEEMKKKVAMNSKKACYWYNRAAAQGHALANNNLGVVYKNGLGVEEDLEKALRYYMESHARGCPHGTFGVGTIYEEFGYRKTKEKEKPFISTEKFDQIQEAEWEDYATAAFYYHAASEMGFLPGLFQLGFLMVTQKIKPKREGYVGKEMVSDGLTLIRDAAQRGHRHAQRYLMDLKKEADSVDPLMPENDGALVGEILRAAKSA